VDNDTISVVVFSIAVCITFLYVDSPSPPSLQQYGPPNSQQSQVQRYCHYVPNEIDNVNLYGAGAQQINEITPMNSNYESQRSQYYRRPGMFCTNH